MKHYPLFQFFVSLILVSFLLAACTFSVQVLNTPIPSEGLPTPADTEPAFELATPTFTPYAPDVYLPSATPTLIAIRADTIPMLEIFRNLQAGELARGLAFSPDGTVLASAGGAASDFAVHLWDVVSGQPLGSLEGHTGIVWSVAFSPDGQLLASVSSDHTAKVWDWRNRTLLKSLDFPGEVVSVSFSPDGGSLAVGGVDTLENGIQNAAVWTYQTASWQPLLKLPEYLDVSALAYSPQGKWLVGGGTSRNVLVWRTSDGAVRFILNHAHQVSKVAVSPDGSLVATATCITTQNSECKEGGVWLWDLASGRLLRKLAGFADVVENVAFSADGSSLIAASRDGVLRFYSIADFNQQYDFNSPGGIGALAVSPDGGFLATGNNRGEVYIWKVVYHP